MRCFLIFGNCIFSNNVCMVSFGCLFKLCILIFSEGITEQGYSGKIEKFSFLFIYIIFLLLY